MTIYRFNGKDVPLVPSQIKSVYEANVNTNEFSDAEQSKLLGIQAGAEFNLPSPYDVAFIAGFDVDLIQENLVIGVFGELIIPRAVIFTGELGSIDTAPTGSVLILDIEKNNISIYSTRPQFSSGALILTPGIFNAGNSFVPGDKLTFKVSQIGSVIPGKGIRLTLLGEV